ncbi:MAG TPA: hypothetical protein VFU93_10410 [Acidimicrobiales bacterium]|nr:hypothetical protein [Acidimicrobiales bacterium]
MRRALAVVLLVLVSCDGRRADSLDVFASASCGILQTWIDAVEDETVALSRAVTPLDDASSRVEHYRLFATAVDLRTWDALRQLKRIAPAVGDGRVAGDALIAAMERSRDVTQELIDLAQSFPEGDDDPEPLVSRISSLFIRLEKAFAHPNKARDELATRYDAFVELPACADYVNPVS